MDLHQQIYQHDNQPLEHADDPIIIAARVDPTGDAMAAKSQYVAKYIRNRLQQNFNEGANHVLIGGCVDCQGECEMKPKRGRRGKGLNEVRSRYSAQHLNSGGEIDWKKVKKTVHDIASVAKYVPHPAVSIPASIIESFTGGRLTLDQLERYNFAPGQITPRIIYPDPSYQTTQAGQHARINRIDEIYRQRDRELALVERPIVGAALSSHHRRNRLAAQMMTAYY